MHDTPEHICEWSRLSADEIAQNLANCPGILLAIGSLEQHGPIGQAGTDTEVTAEIARRAAALAGALTLPALPYGPAQFNMGFPGTISVRAATLAALMTDILVSLARQNVGVIYLVNGHGGNVAPIESAIHDFLDDWPRSGNGDTPCIRLRAWWEFTELNEMRDTAFGAWEGNHATPSEIAITQYLDRIILDARADHPPAPIAAADRALLARDRHGPAHHHRQLYPDGRVGSHSALANPILGEKLLKTASMAVAADFITLLQTWRAQRSALS